MASAGTPSHAKLKVYSRTDPSSDEALELRDRRLSAAQESAESIGRRFYSPFAERLLQFIADYDDGFYRPEKCDVYEPIREVFDRDDLSWPVSWLSQPSGRVMVKKPQPFRYEGFVENHRFPNFWEDSNPEPRPRSRDPVFLTEWCLWFRIKVLKHKSLEEFRQFFLDLCAVTEADYGFLTMEEDHKQKNFLVTKTDTETRTRFVGNNLEVCLPGIYFGNYFGPLYVDFFGAERLQSTPCYYRTPLPEGAWYVQVSDDLDYHKTEKGKAATDAALDYLGRDTFFDIRDPMRRCTVPEYVKANRRRDDPLSV